MTPPRIALIWRLPLSRFRARLWRLRWADMQAAKRKRDRP